jgi:hypothetical protein
MPVIGVPTVFVAALVALAKAPRRTASFIAWGFPSVLLYETGALTGVVDFMAAVGAVLGGLT